MRTLLTTTLLLFCLGPLAHAQNGQAPEARDGKRIAQALQALPLTKKQNLQAMQILGSLEKQIRQDSRALLEKLQDSPKSDSSKRSALQAEWTQLKSQHAQMTRQAGVQLRTILGEQLWKQFVISLRGEQSAPELPQQQPYDDEPILRPVDPLLDSELLLQ